jgi:hypothetical protein
MRKVASLKIEPLADSSWRLRWGLAALVAAAAVIAYWNTLGNEFVSWDDGDYVYNNPLLKGELSAIWGEIFKNKKHEQYYPLVFSSFWIEHKFAGLSPWLYHATQMGLHAINAAMLLFVLRWLGVGLFPATFTAALFAVHPVNVASVAWVAERKNTLSGLFCLVSLLLYFQFRRSGGTWRYWASVAAFLLALLAKTAVVFLPALLVVSDRVLDRRWSKASLRRAMPYVVIAFVMAMMTISVERSHDKSGEPVEPSLRPLIACAAIVHYAGKIVWPVDLLPIYPRWPESFTEPRYWLSAGGLLLAVGLLIRYRRRLGPFGLWCAGLFLLPLMPVLGLVHFNLMQFTFVSDHLMYLSAPGQFLAGALILEWALSRGRSHKAPVGRRGEIAKGTIIAVAILIPLGWLTIRQNRVWHDAVTFWEHTLAGNETCSAGYLNLGNYYRRNQEYEKALWYYTQSAHLLPDHINSPRFYAQCCKRLHRDAEAMKSYQEALRRAEQKSPRYFGVHLEYATYLRSLGRMEEARAVYETVLKKDPQNEGAKAGVNRLTRR